MATCLRATEITHGNLGVRACLAGDEPAGPGGAHSASDRACSPSLLSVLTFGLPSSPLPLHLPFFVTEAVAGTGHWGLFLGFLL